MKTIDRELFGDFEELQAFAKVNNIKIINIIKTHDVRNRFTGYEMFFEHEDKYYSDADYLGVGIEKITAQKSVDFLKEYLRNQIEANDGKLDKTEYDLLLRQVEVLEDYVEILDKRKEYYKGKRKNG